MKNILFKPFLLLLFLFKKCVFNGSPSIGALVFKKEKGIFVWRASSSLRAFDAHGHVQIPTFHLWTCENSDFWSHFPHFQFGFGFETDFLK